MRPRYGRAAASAFDFAAVAGMLARSLGEIHMSTALGLRTWFIAAVAASVVLLAGCDDKKQQAAAPAPKPAVGVRPAAMKGVSESFEFVGHIQAIYKVDLRARIEIG